jgi:hypothetical protein
MILGVISMQDQLGDDQTLASVALKQYLTSFRDSASLYEAHMPLLLCYCFLCIPIIIECDVVSFAQPADSSSPRHILCEQIRYRFSYD